MVSLISNPLRTGGGVRIELAEPSDVGFAIYDALRREVLTVATGRRGAGFHDVPLGVDRLPVGVYVCRLTAGDHSDAITFSVVD